MEELPKIRQNGFLKWLEDQVKAQEQTTRDFKGMMVDTDSEQLFNLWFQSLVATSVYAHVRDTFTLWWNLFILSAKAEELAKRASDLEASLEEHLLGDDSIDNTQSVC